MLVPFSGPPPPSPPGTAGTPIEAKKNVQLINTSNRIILSVLFHVSLARILIGNFMFILPSKQWNLPGRRASKNMKLWMTISARFL
jgi:nitrate reductase gamma subunit